MILGVVTGLSPGVVWGMHVGVVTRLNVGVDGEMNVGVGVVTALNLDVVTGLNVEVGVVGFALLAALGWGIGPVVAKLGMSQGGRSERATLVLLAVGAVLFWIGSVVVAGGPGGVFAGVPPSSLLIFVASGVFGTSLGWLLWFHGVDLVGASVGNVIFYTQPLFAALLAVVFLDERLTLAIGVGMVLIVSGVVLLSLRPTGDVDTYSRWALGLLVLSAVFAAVSTVLNRYGLQATDVTVVEAVTVNTTSALVVLVGYFLAVHDWRTVLSFERADAYFALNGTINAVAIFALFLALNRGRVVVVSPITGTSPLFTTVFAFLLLGHVERVTARTVVSAVLTVAGIAAITVV